MEEESAPEIASHPGGLADDWSKEDDEPIKDNQLPVAAADALDPPPEGLIFISLDLMLLTLPCIFFLWWLSRIHALKD